MAEQKGRSGGSKTGRNVSDKPDDTDHAEALDGSSGPGTGREAPPEDAIRMPQSMVDTSKSGPLAPPEDVLYQGDPPQGYSESSTDHVYAEAGGRTIAGEDFVRLEGDDENEVSGDLFDDSAESKTYVVAKQRIYEVFYYANTEVEARRLLFPEGARVPRQQASRIEAALEAAKEAASSK